METILDLRSAIATYGTIYGATRARITGNTEERTSQGGGSAALDGAWKLGAAPTIEIETESFEQVIVAAGNNYDNQSLVLTYEDGTVNGRTLTVTYATAIAAGDSEIPPAEEAGEAERYTITFACHGDEAATAVTTLAQMLTDAPGGA